MQSDHRIYLDNAATTGIKPEVLAEMQEALTAEFGNPHSVHSWGRKAKDMVEKARRQVAQSVGAEPEQVIFTSGGSEANSLAIRGSLDYLYKQNRRCILTSAYEHASLWQATLDCIGECAVNYLKIGAPDWRTIPPELIGLISVMKTNNETGMDVISRVGLDLQAIKKEYPHILIHSDWVQALGLEPIDFNSSPFDMISISGHKIGAPKGIGALIVKETGENRTLSPIIYGTQEHGLRGGTLNVPAIVGFGKACELACEDIDTTRSIVASLLGTFDAMLEKHASENDFPYEIIDGYDYNVSKIRCVRFPGVDAETLVLLADANGLAISAGSACNSEHSEPSRVLLNLGLSADEARECVRISFDPDAKHPTADIIHGAQRLINSVDQLRNM